jgi:hypothetical protein
LKKDSEADKWSDLKNADSIDSAIVGASGDFYLLKSRFSKKSLAQTFKTLRW